MEIAIAILIVLTIAAATVAVTAHRRATRLQLDNMRLATELDAANRRADDARQAADQRASMLTERMLADNAERTSDDTARRVKTFLDPLKSDIEAFRRLVADGFSDSKAAGETAGELIRQILRSSAEVDKRTMALTSALRGDNRTQGAWGEVILENILQGAGLTKGRDYFTQQTVAENALRPDVTLSLPDGRWIVIDSKNSLTAYLDSLTAPDDDTRKALIKNHLASVKNHIGELRRKNYQDLTPANAGKTQRPDFVIMFMPYEGAFLAAIEADNRLWESAYADGVIIATPTHLMAVLKLVEQLWRGANQQANAALISDEATKLLDKMNGFLNDLALVGISIEKARAAYESAINKAMHDRDSVLHRIHKFDSLGVKSRKPTPQSLIPDTI